MIEPDTWWKEKLVTLVATHTPKCHDITRLISESMERPLPLRTRLAMRVHFLICVWCERYRDQLVLLRKALGESCDSGVEHLHEAMPEDARNRLKAALKKKG